MDDAMIEMLSRYIDGDLDPAEERDIVGRLQADPILRSALESLREIRSSFAVLAQKDEVPADLDALVEPLRRGRPEAIVARPWVRWLATAAVAVLGLSVIIEVNQKSSQQPVREVPRSRPGPPTEPPERFSLAPLPTSSVPPEDQLLGVSERLLASPIPEMEIEESPPLRVLGPLEVPPAAREDSARGTVGGETMPAMPGVAAVETSARSAPSETAKARGELGRDFADDAPVTTADAAAEGEKRALQSVSRRSREGEAPKGQAQLFIFNAGKTSWQAFEPRARCDTGRYAIRVRVGGGVVREVWAIGRAVSESPSQPLCAGELVRGLPVSEVADGEYAAEVVVEHRGARDD